MLADRRLPPPQLEMTVTPKSNADRARLEDELRRLAQRDIDLRIRIDAQSGELNLGGSGELQLDGTLESLAAAGFFFDVGAPQVAYRETLIKPTSIEYAGGRNPRKTPAARFSLALAPNEPERGNCFASKVAIGTMALDALASIEAGVRDFWLNGPFTGFPIVDMIVTLTAAEIAESDQGYGYLSDLVGKAMKEACRTAGCWILEPIMDVEIVCRPDVVGRLIGDIQSRRGIIKADEQRQGRATLHAKVPLGNMFGFVSVLRMVSSPDGTHTMRYSHHSEVPRSVATDPNTFPPAVGMRA